MKTIGPLLVAVVIVAIFPLALGADEQVALQQGSGAPAAKTPAAGGAPPRQNIGPSEIQLLKAELSKIRDELTQLQRQMVAVKGQLNNHESWIEKRSGVVTSFCKDDGQTLMAFNGQSKSCAPYRCNKEWGSCYSGCTWGGDCASGCFCTADGTCKSP